MNTKRPLVDEQSLALAEHFLQDEVAATEDDEWNLAAAIQEAVEDWFDRRERTDDAELRDALNDNQMDD